MPGTAPPETPTTQEHARRWPALLAWALWALALLALPVVNWLDQRLRRAGLQELAILETFQGPLSAPALSDLLALAGVVGVVTLLAGLLVAAVSLVVRFRRARGLERQQLRWLALAAAVSAMSLLAAVAVAVLGEPLAVALIAAGISVAVLPLATGAAILRYRLYDLDRIISRTLAYGLLTVLLGVGYVGVVLGLGRLLPEGSSLVVAAATLAVAAVFQPLRRRVQALVDRRFNRRRYDAAQTIAAFNAHLRDQVDLATLTGELLTVIDQTMQPTQTSRWLRHQELTPRGRAAAR